MRQLRLLRLSTSIVSKISCKFLHCTICTFCTFPSIVQIVQKVQSDFFKKVDTYPKSVDTQSAKSAICASAFFSPSISSGLNPDTYSIIYFVYNTERSNL